MAFFKYFLIRAGVFVPLFVLFLLLGMAPILAGIFAVLIAFCISYLLFRRQREAAAEQLRTRFSGNAKPIRSATELMDANAEDALVDAHPDVTIESDDRRNVGAEGPTRKTGAGGPTRNEGAGPIAAKSSPAPGTPGEIPREFLGP
ncbi:DUF4229 domain-containing protein [Arthrobacter sp. A5]|uniref:DUF4229 domain-containing protein n=1 Tax=Arthrobacter sp. A5 TaxID=576926 RepID=UPI003DA96905